MSIELVVPGNVEHWPAARPTARPIHPASPRRDVTRQHHGIGINTGWHERPPFQVQVAEHMQAHAHIMTDGYPWLKPPIGRDRLSTGANHT